MAKITTDFTAERIGRKVNGVTKKYADEKARAEINKIFTDGAFMGQGLAVCSTDASTAAKTATLDNYLLLKNVPVSIRFTKGVTASNATLNINSMGAKPLYINGVPLQPGIIRAGMTITVVYDGTNYNIIDQMGLEPGGSPSDLSVDMGLPSGLKWAKRRPTALPHLSFSTSVPSVRGAMWTVTTQSARQHLITTGVRRMTNLTLPRLAQPSAIRPQQARATTLHVHTWVLLGDFLLQQNFRS